MTQGLKKGSILDHGKYEVLKVLGQGGFGITYLALDVALNKLRAIKEFFPQDFCNRDYRTSQLIINSDTNVNLIHKLKSKFIKEAQKLASLDQHSGIITLFTVFEENDTAYYVMDYIEGDNLSSIIKNSGPLSVDRAVKYILEISNALSYVHSHHINHLDVKPANIMIRKRDDKPILIDFGLSKQYDSQGYETSTTPVGLSHGFAPLEQYNNDGLKEFSPQTDVYSLAATLYYIVSGTIPPHATEILDKGLIFPSNFPSELKCIIVHAMASRRMERPESIEKFINNLNKELKISERDNKHHELNEEKHDNEHTIQIIPENPEVHTGMHKNDVNNLSITYPPKKRKKRSAKYIAGLFVLIIAIIFSLFLFLYENNNDIKNSNSSNNQNIEKSMSSEGDYTDTFSDENSSDYPVSQSNYSKENEYFREALETLQTMRDTKPSRGQSRASIQEIQIALYQRVESQIQKGISETINIVKRKNAENILDEIKKYRQKIIQLDQKGYATGEAYEYIDRSKYLLKNLMLSN